MGNRVFVPGLIGATVVFAAFAALLFNPSPAHAAPFWDGFPFAPRSSGGKDVVIGGKDFLNIRLCERQLILGNRLRVPLITPGKCDQTPPTPEPTVTLTANPESITAGESSTLTWSSTNATSCTAFVGWNGSRPISGSEVVSPTVTTTYQLDCTGPGGVGSDDATVTVNVVEPNAPTLTLVKTVTNNNGGTTTPSAWTLSADGPSDISGVTGSSTVTNAQVEPGTYSLSESGPGGYSASQYSCVKNGGAAVSGNSITLAAGDTAVCTIENDDQAGTLTIRKIVIRDNGGSAATTSFAFMVDGGSSTAFEADGENNVSVSAGMHTVTEASVSGYSTSYNNCENVFVANGETEICTITNNDTAPENATLTLVKSVMNNSGGTSTPSMWTIAADGPTDISGISGSAAVTNASVSPGTYTLSESGGPSGYTASIYSCQKNDGPDVVGNEIVLANGDSAVCTITNDDQAGTLVVKKVVNRDDGGTTATSTFAFQIDGGSSTNFEADGQNDVTINAGTHSVTEPAVAGWTSLLENCTDIFVPNGGTVTCTITNNDDADGTPTLDLVASPTSVEEGSTGNATSTLTWTSTNATSCIATNGWSGSKTPNNTEIVQPTATTSITYTLECGNGTATTTDSETVTVTPPAQTLDHLLISEVYYNVASTTAGTESHNEWVEIFNPTAGAIDISGWEIADGASADVIPAGSSVAAGGYLLIAATSTLSSQWSIPGGVPIVVVTTIGSGLNDGGDVVTLTNTGDTVVDAVSWGSNTSAFSPSVSVVADGNSIVRSSLLSDTNTASDWTGDATPAPGQ